MNDLALRQNIIDELVFDPSIDAANIGVAVEEGVVTLSGHVGSYAEKIAAEMAVKRVKGVRALAETLEVRFQGHKRHADDEIAARALDIIEWDALLPNGAIGVKVQKGWVTLTGEVQWHFQRVAAERAVMKLGGVVGVTNVLSIKPSASIPDVKKRIEGALKRNADVEAERVEVAVLDGNVTLKGGVTGWRERTAAERAAWSIPGVVSVTNNLAVRG
ncbi:MULTISPECIES: BON domain-containing protein [unclassified Rhizobium]|uniref:BON domain-containing protein n=1 Tax=unclassified Rhizobium TaxID=2613769 RepID=UPI00161EDCBA|nr:MULTISPECIES: BON domain-containing protein [unclassified Rhizobium]MBB3545166.1 osmotically-inducible protein OsmY [Rhizobium sp. BK399]MCS3743580.1 osmotically-inducible protein OsmY [Rhizobium sp. BK661]MCS4096534.1 osmotically-inducible protein OsmY [Rhizobium sp. BK176]